MNEMVREQARQWLANLAAALDPWRLVVVSGDDLFAGVMVWTYPASMRRVASLAELRALLSPGAPEPAAAPAPASPAPTSPGHGLDPASLLPLPQQILPIGSDPSVPLNPAEERLFFLLCDDLPDGEVEQALALLEACLPPPHRRVLTVLPDSSERQRLQRLQEAGLDGLCTLGSCGQGRIYTALAAIANGGTYLDPLFRQRLKEEAPADRVRAAEDLTREERRLLREVCRGCNSQEIARQHCLTDTTVRRTLSRAYQRLGVRDRAQAIGWCFAHGVIRAEELQQLYGPPVPGKRAGGHGVSIRGRRPPSAPSSRR